LLPIHGHEMSVNSVYISTHLYSRGVVERFILSALAPYAYKQGSALPLDSVTIILKLSLDSRNYARFFFCLELILRLTFLPRRLNNIVQYFILLCSQDEKTC